jgi:hypothetical protein
MRRWIARCGLSGVMFWAAGCGQTPTNLAESEACAQTHEFGNYGCARIVVMVEGPPQPWPVGRRWDVRAMPARDGTGADLALAPRPDTGAVRLGLVRWQPPAPGAGDSASVWVSARMLEDPRPVGSGVPLQVFAADSVLHVARFAAVGARPPVDTVRLTLRRP